MKLRPLAYLIATLPCMAAPVHAQTPAAQQNSAPITTLETVSVEASADASAEGLAPAYAGGQVATGAKLGILGTKDNMSAPFSVTSYTNELIQDKQARSVADVLLNDPSVRVARGFGNFQETYFIRGQVLYSDDVAYNGLYGLLPRQYIASEFFERVDVLRGASTFLTSAPPGGSGAGGVVNLVPKRASNEPLTRLTTGVGNDGQGSLSTDISRRFGPDDSVGIRLNAVARGGDGAVDDENSRLGGGMLGLDWRGDRLRLSADVGWQENRLKRIRPSVDVLDMSGLPSIRDAEHNWAQPWTYSNERDVFSTLRGEYDISDNVTTWAAFGLRDSTEKNQLAGMDVTNSSTGDGYISRFDNKREEFVYTGEVGMRIKGRTGPVGHEVVLSATYFDKKEKNNYAMTFSNSWPSNLYHPTMYDSRDVAYEFQGGDLDNPLVRNRVRTSSFAIGDTLSLLDDSVLFTLGLRHQRLAMRTFDYDTGELIDGGDYKTSRDSPALGLVVKLNPAFSVYANYIEQLAQGSVVGDRDADNYGEMLPPYVARQREVGIKYDGGRIGGGLAFFSTNRPHGTRTSDNRVAIAGEDRYQGIELTVFGEAARGVRVLGGVTWFNAKQRDTGTASVDGNRVVGVPRYQANMGVEWDLPGLDGVTIDGRMVYTGSFYADDANELRVPSWTRFDAGARYVTEVGGRMLTLRARVENIANKAYWASAGGYIGSGATSGYLVAGGPRTFWLSASMDF